MISCFNSVDLLCYTAQTKLKENTVVNKAQLEREITWLEDEITKLEAGLHKKPSKQKQINEYKRQIEQKLLNIELAV